MISYASENEIMLTENGTQPGWSLKSVEEQIAGYRLIWPKLKDCSAEALVAPYIQPYSKAVDYRTVPEPALVLPANVEGLIVLPKFKALSRLVGYSFWRRKWPYYNRVLRMILIAMKEARDDFINSLGTDEYIGPQYEWMDRSSSPSDESSSEDFVALPGQTGKFHNNHRDRKLVNRASNEIPMTSIEAGCLLLIHPDRFTTEQDLDLDCLGSVRSSIEPEETRFGDYYTYFKYSSWRFRKSEGLRFTYKDRRTAYPNSGAGTLLI